VGRLAELIAPSRLGAGFRWLLPSSWLTNLGDGFALAAGPLLVASLTDDAFLVALAATFQWLPPLLFAPIAGALTDRHNRLRIIQLVNLARVGMLAVLVLAIATGYGSIGVVLTALFVLSTAEVFADSSTSTLLPMLVARDDLAIANSRLLTGMITFNQLAGPPLGAALFVIGSAWPFGAEALLIGMSVVLVSRIVLPAHVDAEIRVGPLWRRYAASWVTRPGCVEWAAGTSSGAVRMSRLDSDRTLVEVELFWQPGNAVDAALARADVARRRVASELDRLSAVVESEAAEERLGCLVA
jgi:hypothetical protein